MPLLCLKRADELRRYAIRRRVIRVDVIRNTARLQDAGWDGAALIRRICKRCGRVRVWERRTDRRAECPSEKTVVRRIAAVRHDLHIPILILRKARVVGCDNDLARIVRDTGCAGARIHERNLRYSAR